MDAESVRELAGKLCRIILKNNYNYTAIIPKFVGTTFTVKDKFGDTVRIDCDYIATIQEISNQRRAIYGN